MSKSANLQFWSLKAMTSLILSLYSQNKKKRIGEQERFALCYGMLHITGLTISLQIRSNLGVRSKDKGFVVQSNDEATKRCLYMVILKALGSNKS